MINQIGHNECCGLLLLSSTRFFMFGYVKLIP